MIIVQICIGSSCHLKGSYDIVEMMKQSIADEKLDDEIVLAGSFCIGKCNREGVTIQVDDDVYTGITKDNFKEFWNKDILRTVSERR